MIVGLKKARALLAGGWSGPKGEPFCIVRGPGVQLDPAGPGWRSSTWFHSLDVEAEGLERYSVSGALFAVGLGDEAWQLLEQAAGRADELQAWLQEWDRSLAHVLALFTAAIQRSKKRMGERRG